MKRYDIINWFIKEYGYTSYLEIGIDNPANCLNRIECETKHSVDPFKGKPSKTHFLGTSNEFFKKDFFGQLIGAYGIIFIDGLHENLQVMRDIYNSLWALSDNGTIIVHDCNPQTSKAAEYPRTGQAIWNGTVFQAFAHFRRKPDLTMCCVDTDHGCGIIRRGSQDVWKGKCDSYQYLEEHRHELLNLISPEQMIELFRCKNTLPAR